MVTLKMAYCVVMMFLVMQIYGMCKLSLASSHWIVTEDGKLNSQDDSVFNLRRPYDLVAFMRQEEREKMLGNLKNELLNRKAQIEKNEDRDSAGLEHRFYATDIDCIKAGKPLPEFDLYISTVYLLENKGIRAEEHIDIGKSLLGHAIKKPDCQLFTNLDFSIYSFEHFEAMKNRSNLSGSPELGLKSAIILQENVDAFGHHVHDALIKNNNSWVLYNMAAFFWRIKGQPFQAVECLRRALHCSPRQHKDVALISLANILHRAHYSNEAAILLHASTELSRHLIINHFTLGNIYAVMGEYNKSVICYDNTLKIQPDFPAALKQRHAVLCRAKLERELEAQHSKLQTTLQQLKEYQQKHDEYHAHNAKLLSEQVSADVKVLQRLAYEQAATLDDNVDGRSEDGCCGVGDRHGGVMPHLESNLNDLHSDHQVGVDHFSLSSTAEADGGHSCTQKGLKDNAVNYSMPVLFQRMKNNVTDLNQDAEHLAPGWPSMDECDGHNGTWTVSPRTLSTVFLSPEEKGFEVKMLLSEAQGLRNGVEHPLPWYPPVCLSLLDLPKAGHGSYGHPTFLRDLDWSRSLPKITDPSMKPSLEGLVNDGQVTGEEVGQRIFTALKENVGPRWVLFNMAGLFWRVKGSVFHAVECLRRSLHLCPPDYHDVPLNNLANVLYRNSSVKQAISVMRQALAVNEREPTSNLLFGHLLWADGNYSGATLHYHRVLEVYPGMDQALSSLRALRCYVKYHYVPPKPTAPKSSKRSCNRCRSQSNENHVSTCGKGKNRGCSKKSMEGNGDLVVESASKTAKCNKKSNQHCAATIMDVGFGNGEHSDLPTGSEPNVQHVDCLNGNSVHNNDHSLFFPATVFDSEYVDHVHDLPRYYRAKGLCSGQECDKFNVPAGHHPHIKLEYADGVLYHKLLFNQEISEVIVSPTDCVIFNNGSLSIGCTRKEFMAYVSLLT